MQYLDDLILDQIDSKKERLESMLLIKNSLKHELLNILIEYVYNSNYIEGSKLSHYETRIIIETSKEIMARSKYFQHLVINHTNAFSYIRENVKNPMTSQDILELHALTMDFIDKMAGKYRENRDIEIRMEKFLDKLDSQDDYHPIEKTAIIQGFFHRVRPFNNGTGPVSRLASKWVLNREGYVFGLPLNPFEVKYYRKCVDKARKGTFYPLVRLMSICVEHTLDQLLSDVRPLNVIPIEEAMRNNHLNIAQMLESINRGDYRAFKENGVIYVTKVPKDQLTYGTLFDEIEYFGVKSLSDFLK